VAKTQGSRSKVQGCWRIGVVALLEWFGADGDSWVKGVLVAWIRKRVVYVRVNSIANWPDFSIEKMNICIVFLKIGSIGGVPGLPHTRRETQESWSCSKTRISLNDEYVG